MKGKKWNDNLMASTLVGAGAGAAIGAYGTKLHNNKIARRARHDENMKAWNKSKEEIQRTNESIREKRRELQDLKNEIIGNMDKSIEQLKNGR